MTYNQNKTKIRQASPESFLEALRDLKSDVQEEAKIQVKKMVTSDIPEALGLAPAIGTLRPNESFSISEQVTRAETRGYEQASKEYQSRLVEIREQERQTFLRAEAAKKEEIKSVQAQIRSLTAKVGQFKQEVEVATMQAVVNPGAYHRNFFHHLRIFISTLTARVESSRHWLATTNSRAKKQGFYWSQVNKSGTKYLLSSERYMVTSTG